MTDKNQKDNGDTMAPGEASWMYPPMRDDVREVIARLVDGSEFEVPATSIIAAISQEPNFNGFEDIGNRKEWIKANEWGETEVEGVYAGGDVAFGPRIAIEAVAEGRRAAKGIDTFLTGREDEPGEVRIRVFDTFGYDHPFARGDYEAVPRGRVPHVPPERRRFREPVETRQRP